MTERPIPFSGEMVRSLLAGTKTQTRRLAKFEPLAGMSLVVSGLVAAPYHSGAPELGWVLTSRGGGGGWNDHTRPLLCPYGVPGDRLWAKEAWRLPKGLDAFSGAEVGAALAEGGLHPDEATPRYEADGRGPGLYSGRYRHARFMPRWASRITLPVLSVRVERLQAITEEDARAEGVRCESSLAWDEGMAAHAITGCDPYAAAVARGHRAGFRELWDRINGPGSWDANPWVWVVGFGPAEVRS